MCFSAQASFAAAGVLSLIGVASLVKAKEKRIRPFAVIPLFFALQQALEGVIWLTVQGSPSSWLYFIAVYGFTLFAGFVWPIWIPYSLYVPERNAVRARILRACLILGSLVGVAALMAIVLFGISADVADNHIAYHFINTACMPLSKAVVGIWWLFYIIAVVISFFVSTLPYAWLAGSMGGSALVLAYVAYTMAVGSVWCFFAALISTLTYWVVDSYNKNL